MKLRAVLSFGSITVCELFWCAIAGAANVPATPSDYTSKLATLAPGDTLELAAGDYTSGMTLSGMNGAQGQPITIEGPAGGAARFLGNASRNTIDITNSSYITIRNLTLDGQDIVGIDAIKAGGGATDWAHHITIEGCTIERHDGGTTSQQTVGISTKIVAWDWVVRNNLIDGAGTGIYLGNSDGTRAFIGGLIEHNVFRKTLGYNMEIKYQLARESVPGVPTDDRVTIIRHNVFIKSSSLPSPDGVRPNLLVDGFPDSGPGSNDHYEIYGNLFFHNDDDALLQASGRVHVHDNIFVDSLNPALRMIDHDGKTVIEALVYNNTIYDTATGVAFSSAPSGISLVAGNAIFSPAPISGTMTDEHDDVTDAVSTAASYVVQPSKILGQMDFYPIAGSALHGSVVDVSKASYDVDHDRDFNGTLKDFTYRGAYQGEGTNPGWPLSDGFKPETGSGGTAGAAATGGAAGTPASGGAAGATGGNAGTTAGGTSGSSGTTAISGGSSGSGSGSAGTSNGAASGDDSGCGCRTRRSGANPIALLAIALFVGLSRRVRTVARAARSTG